MKHVYVMDAVVLSALSLRSSLTDPGLGSYDGRRSATHLRKMKRKRIAAPFLPTTRDEMKALGWDSLDVLIVTGDAYVDHPSFGAALIGRYIESLGYRVGILPQPDWRNLKSFLQMGVPRLFVGVTSGAMDSMVSHYTSLGKRRREDHFSEGGKAGLRPDRAVIVYTNRIREAMPGVPVVIGGIEASLRRTSHYDFWTNRVRKSILLDSKATILVYGMGEKPVAEILKRLECKEDLEGIPGTAVYRSATGFSPPKEGINCWLPDHESLEEDPVGLLEVATRLEMASQPWSQHTLLQRADTRVVVLFPPSEPLTQKELDSLYELPFSRRPHPRYRGEVPAYTMIKDSLTALRGCPGGCSFCSLALHQGRVVQSRSAESLMEEARRVSRLPGFKGTLTDVGGPSANLYEARCLEGQIKGTCKRPSCLFPNICKKLQVNQMAYVRVLDELNRLPGISHVFVSSGIRHDVALTEPDFIRALVESHVSGHLKVAPEHSSPRVLNLMRKPNWEVYEAFEETFKGFSKKAGKELYLVPYLMVGFPGCTPKEMSHLVQDLRKKGIKPRQVQLFLPTPMTMATAMFAAQRTPNGREKIFVARRAEDRKAQFEQLLYWHKKGPEGSEGRTGKSYPNRNLLSKKQWVRR